MSVADLAMPAEQMIQERLRRLLAIGGSIFYVVWGAVSAVAVLRPVAENLASETTWSIVLAANLLTALCTVLGCLGAMVVTAMYSPGGFSDRLVGRLVPAGQAGRELLERCSWLPLDITLVTMPLLVIHAITVQGSLATGTMSPTDLRLSWAGTITLTAAVIFAAARFTLPGALVYVAVIHFARFGVAVAIAPAAASDAWLISVQGLIFGVMIALLVAAIRAAAVALDARMTRVTAGRIGLTARAARAVVHQQADRVILGHVLPALDAATVGGEDAALRAHAHRALAALEDVTRAPADREADVVAPGDLLTEITEAVRVLNPTIPVETSCIDRSPIRGPVLIHLERALGVLLAAIAPGPEDGRHVAVSIATLGSGVSCRVTLEPGFARDEELRRVLVLLLDRAAALPGTTVTTTSPGHSSARGRRLRRLVDAGDARFTSVTFGWRPEDVMQSDPADAEDGVHGNIRLAYLATNRLEVWLGIALFGLLAAGLTSIAVLTLDLYRSQLLNLGTLLGYFGLWAVLLSASYRNFTGARAGWATVGSALATAIVLTLSSLLNLADPASFVMEVQWWQGTAVIVLLVWLTGAAHPGYSVAIAVLLGVAMSVWGHLTEQDTGLFTGGALPLVTAIIIAALTISWASHEIHGAATERRRDRVVKLAEANLAAVTQARREVSRYVDDVVRPYLAQQATGTPMTPAMRARAGQLAARIRDDGEAPCFRGSEVTRAAGDARVRGVEVTLRDHGGLADADPYVLHQVVQLTVRALDALVDGSALVCVHPQSEDRVATVDARPSDEKPRHFEVLADGAVVYDGIRVRATKQVVR